MFLVLFVTLPACHRAAPITTNPERRHQIYDMACRRGQNDRLTPLPFDWHRYLSKLDSFSDVPERESIFATGYEDGFNQHPDEERNTTEIAYDAGYRRAQADMWLHRPADLRTDIFDPTAYAHGYNDAFNRRPHAFHRPY